MDEAQLKRELCDHLRKELKTAVVIRHEDRFTHGIPDISVTYRKRTVWLEVKFGNPDFQVKGIQELTMLRLQIAGVALFVVYHQDKRKKTTFVVPPNRIKNPIETHDIVADGFNHNLVLSMVKSIVGD